MKTCTTCGETKPLDGFSKNRDGVKGPILHPSCKVCRSKRAAKWAKDNAEQHAATKHAWTLRTTYGISKDEYAEMLEKQDGKCAICGRSEQSRHGTNNTPFRLSLDHCHATGKVRGLLCNRCNRSIGLMDDNVDLLRKAIDYLER